jgi:hypothetical protein
VSAQSKIPTPAELIDAARKSHDAEADALIARIVAKLRANPSAYVTESALMPVLRVAEARMSERGWVCRVWHGDARVAEARISVTAPGGAR